VLPWPWWPEISIFAARCACFQFTIWRCRFTCFLRSFPRRKWGGVVDDWVWHFSYLTNVLVFLRREWVGPLSPYWSLAVEEQFYIGWFWLVLLVPRSRLPAVIVLVICAALSFRLAAIVNGINHYADVLLPACMDTLAAGALLAVATHACYQNDFAQVRTWLQSNAGRLGWVVLLCWVLLVLSSFGLDKENLVRRLVTNSLSSIVFVYFVYRCYQGFGGAIGRLLSTPQLIAVGRFSYGIYVYHMLVLLVYRQYLSRWIPGIAFSERSPVVQKAVDCLVLTLLTLAFAYWSWVYIEKPCLRIKNRYSEGLGST
jgi:peptidoglycan/LPS O-acetylase OafA/YrhL